MPGESCGTATPGRLRGPYVLGNDEQDSAGYRVGMRGYAYPDLLLQIAVSQDDIFNTNAAFQVTWFVGRTRNNFQPACGLADRMREPVMRNDYVALQRTTEVGGEPLTGTDGEPLRFVHVDANAPSGGNGTYEHPLDNVGNVHANSEESDIVLLYSDGTFTGQNTLRTAGQSAVVGRRQRRILHGQRPQQKGVVVIPETSPGRGTARGRSSWVRWPTGPCSWPTRTKSRTSTSTARAAPPTWRVFSRRLPAPEIRTFTTSTCRS